MAAAGEQPHCTISRQPSCSFTQSGSEGGFAATVETQGSISLAKDVLPAYPFEIAAGCRPPQPSSVIVCAHGD
jgi:hypothetical protein